jgi:hypothetical protein
VKRRDGGGHTRRQARAGFREAKKKSFFAQEALVLLAQLAHNLAVWFERWF